VARMDGQSPKSVAEAEMSNVNFWLQYNEKAKRIHVDRASCSNRHYRASACYSHAGPEPSDPPPAEDGEFLWLQGAGMKRVCTNRHTGEVNMLFMDWSIRKARLKELWRLKWHRTFEPTEPDWPEWIEKL